MFEISLIPMLCVFAAVTALIWLLLSRFVERDDHDWQDRLKTFVAENAADRGVSPLANDAGEQQLVSKVVPKLSSVLEPKDKIEHQALALNLARAGFSGTGAVAGYLAIKCLLMLAFAVIGGALGAALFGPSERMGLLCVGGAAVGMLIPSFMLKQLAKSRQDRIFLSLPGAIDLLVIAMEAGTGIDQAMNEVALELKTLAPDLALELELYSNEMRLGGNRRKALHNLGMRSGVDDLNSLANVLLQADRFGTGIALALRDMSRISRQKRRQKAEERASKTAVKLLIPLILFIFPGIFVILVGPAAITIFRDMMTL